MKRALTWRLRAAGALLSFLLLGSAAVAETPPDAARVLIKDFMFMPMELKTRVGTSVTWVNLDDEPHTVLSEGLFRSGALDSGEQYTFRFDKPGTYQVFCSIHPQMKATIIVQ